MPIHRKAARVIRAVSLVWLALLWSGCALQRTPPRITPTASMPLKRTGAARLPKATHSPTPNLGQTQAAIDAATEQAAAEEGDTPATEAPPPAPTAAINPLACLPEEAADGNSGEIGLVTWIQDGETIVVDFQGRRSSVRLLGLDAPPIAAQKLTALLENQVVRVFRDPSEKFAVDLQGNPLGYVLTADGEFINYEMLRQGEAGLDEQAQGIACAAIFAGAQTTAKAAAVGMWGVQAVAGLPSGTPPPTRVPPTAVALAPTPTLTLAGPVPTLAPGVTPSATFLFTSTAQNTQPGGGGGGSATLSPTPTVGGGVAATRTPTVSSGGAATPTATPSGEGFSDVDVEIANIYWSGAAARGEADEYIELHNTGSQAFDLGGWSVYAENTFAELYFPPGFTLAPGAFCRVYTNEIHPDSCAGKSFGQTSEVWLNDGDCGGLYDPNEDNLATYCY